MDRQGDRPGIARAARWLHGGVVVKTTFAPGHGPDRTGNRRPEGVPVIGFDIGTRSDFIEDSINGFLCDKNNLKETIEKSFQFSEYEKLSNNALLKSKEFDNSYVTKKQIEIYKHIMEKE